MSRKRRIIFVVLALALIGAIGYGVYTILTPKNDQVAEDVKVIDVDQARDDAPPSETNINKLYASASEEASKGNIDESIRQYEAAISTAENDEQKAEYYIQLADILVSFANNPQQALPYAQKGEEIMPSFRSAAQLSVVYRALSNVTEAEKYEKLIEERIPSEPEDE